jgi:type IV pilus assembly protein PilB
MLIQRGHIDAAQLESALAHQRRWGGQLGRAIVHLGFMTESALAETLAAQLGVPHAELEGRMVPPQVLSLLPVKLMRTRRVLPLARLSEHRRGPLLVAVPDPGDLHVLDEIAFATGLEVRPVLAAESDLDRAIRRLVGDVSPTPALSHLAPIELPVDTSPLTTIRRSEQRAVATA